MAIVVNSGPLISLTRIGLLDLLPKLFGEILVPPAVFQEVTGDPSRLGAREVREAKWLQVMEVSDHVAVSRLGFWLDQGESEVLVLAQQTGATAVIDEKRGRNLAAALGVPQTGTLGVLLTAKKLGLIPAITPCLIQLRDTGMRLSPRLAHEARLRAGEA